MIFPESERVVFDHNPLETVICQLRFPTILEIGTSEPASFQNKIRSAYPIYNREDEETFPKDIVPTEVSQFISQFHLSKSPEVTHKFLTEDSLRFFSISTDFLAVTDLDYKQWEQFWEQVESAQSALEEVYKPAFYSRIGLRYKDIINRTELGLDNEPWENLIHPSFIGLLGEKDISNNIEEIRSITLVSIEEMRGAFVRLRHGLVPKKQESDSNAYQIDADFFIVGRKESNDVKETLHIFNRLAGNFFRWVATDRLKEVLGPHPIK